jgi:hypothetical protein
MHGRCPRVGSCIGSLFSFTQYNGMDINVAGEFDRATTSIIIR